MDVVVHTSGRLRILPSLTPLNSTECIEQGCLGCVDSRRYGLVLMMPNIEEMSTPDLDHPPSCIPPFGGCVDDGSSQRRFPHNRECSIQSRSVRLSAVARLPTVPISG